MQIKKEHLAIKSKFKFDLPNPLKMDNINWESHCPQCKIIIMNRYGYFTCLAALHDKVDGEFCKEQQLKNIETEGF